MSREGYIGEQGCGCLLKRAKFLTIDVKLRLSAVPSTAGAITRRACSTLIEAGVELTPLLARAGLTCCPAARVSIRRRPRKGFTQLVLTTLAGRDLCG